MGGVEPAARGDRLRGHQRYDREDAALLLDDELAERLMHLDGGVDLGRQLKSEGEIRR